MTQGTHVKDPCASVQDDLKAFADGELSWLRRHMVRRHLAKCASCREEAQAMQMLHEGLRSGGDAAETVAPALRERILTQVANIPPLPAPAPHRAPLVWQYGLAASLIVNCCFLFITTRNIPNAPLAPMPDMQPSQSASAPARPSTSISSKLREQTQPSAAVSTRPHSLRDGLSVDKDAQPLSGSGTSKQHPVSSPPNRLLSQEAVPVKNKAVFNPSSFDGVAPSGQANGASRIKMMKPMIGNPTPDANRAGAGRGRQTDHPMTVPVSPPTTAAKTSAPGMSSQSAPAPPASIAADTATGAPPAPPAMAAPITAPAPAPMARSFGPSGFGGGAGGFGGGTGGFGGAPPASHLFGIGREKPTAQNAWPGIALLSATEAHGIAAKEVQADWQVDEQGAVSDIHVMPTGSAALDAAIGDIIRRNHYLPALKDGKPASARMSYVFVINP